MKWKFVVVGKPSLQYARLGIEEYFKRLQKYTAAELITVKNGTQEEEGGRLLKGSEGSYRIVLTSAVIQQRRQKGFAPSCKARPWCESKS